MGASESTIQPLLTFEADAFDALAAHRQLAEWCKPLHLEVSPPLLAGWYNEQRRATADGTQLIDAPEDAVVFAIASVPGYLDLVVEHFARAHPDTDFVDATTNEILMALRSALPLQLEATVTNTDQGPPYYHVQSVGAVAGFDQHIEANEQELAAEDPGWTGKLSDELQEKRDPKMWGSDKATLRKIFGVNVHPVWGGWYAYRAILVLKGARQASLPKPAPLKFLAPKEARRIISEYNLRHETCIWRDLSEEAHPPAQRYSPEEYLFFSETSSAKRRRYLQLRAAHFATPPEPRWKHSPPEPK